MLSRCSSPLRQLPSAARALKTRGLCLGRPTLSNNALVRVVYPRSNDGFRIKGVRWAHHNSSAPTEHQDQHPSSSTSSSTGSCLNLFDSLSESLQTVPLASSPKAKALAWYTCGPTTYAPSHMGHARTYVCLDIVRRIMESQTAATTPGKNPLFVMNITDVDDKILAAAASSTSAAVNEHANNDNNEQRDPLALARHYEMEFWKDMDSLNCLRPHVVTRVTEHVESDIVPYIQKLVDKGMAYPLDDGVYFHVRAFDETMGHVTKYGKLAPPAASASQAFFSTTAPYKDHDDDDDNSNSKNNNKEEEPATTSPKKQDPRDFVLWKFRKPGEDLHWPSPWGDGRPGWHIECSAMIQAVQERFQETHQFLVHAGGVDLKFPHHTNEIAQAEAFTGKNATTWIPHWVHTGHLHIDGLKMSKSLKNFVSIQDFLAEFDTALSSLESPADDFRLWCLGLSGSYRGPATFSRKRIDEARVIRQKMVRFLIDGEQWIGRSQPAAAKKWQTQEHKLFQVAQEAHQNGVQALLNDIDGSTFVGELVRVSEMGNAYLNQTPSGPVEPMKAVLGTLRHLLSLVGFSEKTTQVGLKNWNNDNATTSPIVGGESALVEELVRFRSAVRQAALKDAQSKTASDNMKEILRICDQTRDTVFPAMGIELLDGKVLEDDEAAADNWRFCLPRSPQDDKQNDQQEGGSTTTTTSSVMDLEPVPLKDYFRVGQYDNMFLEFTEDGIPMTNVDGSEVSKRLLKKLMKKQQAHRTRLEQFQS
jgi:cysteinyl-tRNA synthetase